MSAQAVEKITPVERGSKDFERLGRLFRAADHNLTKYRLSPSTPNMQRVKSAYWAEYQDVLAELMEVLNG